MKKDAGRVFVSQWMVIIAAVVTLVLAFGAVS